VTNTNKSSKTIFNVKTFNKRTHYHYYTYSIINQPQTSTHTSKKHLRSFFFFLQRLTPEPTMTYLTLKNRGSVMNRYEHCRTGANVGCVHVSRRNSIPVLLRASGVEKFYPTTSTTRIR